MTDERLTVCPSCNSEVSKKSYGHILVWTTCIQFGDVHCNY